MKVPYRKYSQRIPLSTRLGAALLCLTLLPAHADLPLYAADAAPPTPDNRSAGIQIPSALGTVEESFRGNPETVILLEDAHAIPEAQKSLRDLLLHLQKNNGLQSVAVEGVLSHLDLNLLKSYPDSEEARKFFNLCLERGELPGSSAAALAEESRAEYFGVEDWDTYEQGLHYYRESLENKERFEEKIAVLREELEKEKRASYSPELLRVDDGFAAFTRNHEDLAGLLQILAGFQNPPVGSDLETVWKEMSLENSRPEALQATLRRAAEQVKAALDTGTFPRQSQTTFHAMFQKYQTSRISPESFALFLQEFTAGTGIDPENPELLRLAAVQGRKLRDLEGSRFFESLEAYVRAVKESLFQNQNQKELDRRSRRLDLLERLAHLELTPQEWQEWSADPVKTFSEESLMASPTAFYRNALRRDEIFLEKMTDKMKRRGERTAALVAGGFHARGLTALLRARNISYVRVRPRISGIPETSAYQAQMQGKMSWSSYYREEAGRVSLFKAFMRYSRDELLKTAKVSRGVLLKQWRDQVIRDLARQNRVEKASVYTAFIDEAAGDEAASWHPEWLKKVQALASGLRRLDGRGPMTEQSILRLISLSRTQTLVAASGDPLAFASPDLLAMTGLSPRPEPIQKSSVPEPARTELRVAREDQAFVQGFAGSDIENLQLFMDALDALINDHAEEVEQLPRINFGRTLPKKILSKLDGDTAAEQIEQILDLPSSEAVFDALKEAFYFEGETDVLTLRNPELVTLVRRQLTGAFVPDSGEEEPLKLKSDAEFSTDATGRLVPVEIKLIWPRNGHEITLRIKKEQRPDTRKPAAERVNLEEGWGYTVRVSGELIRTGGIGIIPEAQDKGPYVLSEAEVALGLSPGEYAGLQGGLTRWLEGLINTPLTPRNPQLRAEMRNWHALILAGLSLFAGGAAVEIFHHQTTAQSASFKRPVAFYDSYLDQLSKDGYSYGPSYDRKTRPWSIGQRKSAADAILKALAAGEVRGGDYLLIQRTLEEAAAASRRRMESAVFDKDIDKLAAQIEKMRKDGVTVSEDADALKTAEEITDLYLGRIQGELDLQRKLAKGILAAGVDKDTVKSYLENAARASIYRAQTDHFEKFLYKRYFHADPKDTQMARVQAAFRQARMAQLADLKTAAKTISGQLDRAEIALEARKEKVAELEKTFKDSGEKSEGYAKQLADVRGKLKGESLSDGGLLGQREALVQKQREHQREKEYAKVRSVEAEIVALDKQIREVRREEELLKDSKYREDERGRKARLDLLTARSEVSSTASDVKILNAVLDESYDLIEEYEAARKKEKSVGPRPEMRMWPQLLTALAVWAGLGGGAVVTLLETPAARAQPEKRTRVYYDLYLDQISKDGYETGTGFDRKIRPWTLGQRSQAVASLLKAREDGDLRLLDYDRVIRALEEGVLASRQRMERMLFDADLKKLTDQIAKLRKDGVDVTADEKAAGIARDITDLYLEKISGELRLQREIARAILAIGGEDSEIWTKFLAVAARSKVMREQTDAFEKNLYSQYLLADPKDEQLARVKKAFQDSRFVSIAELEPLPKKISEQHARAEKSRDAAAGKVSQIELDLKAAETRAADFDKQLLAVRRKLKGESLSDGGLQGELKALRDKQAEYERNRQFKDARALEKDITEVGKKVRDAEREESALKDSKDREDLRAKKLRQDLSDARTQVSGHQGRAAALEALYDEVTTLISERKEAAKKKKSADRPELRTGEPAGEELVLPAVALLTPDHPAYAGIFPAGLKDDDAVLHLAAALKTFAESSPGPFLMRIPARRHESDVWSETGLSEMDMTAEILGFLRAHPPAMDSLRLEGDHLKVPLPARIPGYESLAELNFGPLPNDLEMRRVIDKVRSKGRGISDLYSLVLSRFQMGSVQEEVFSHVWGLLDDSGRESMLSLAGSPELGSALYSEEGWKIFLAQEERRLEKLRLQEKQLARDRAMDALAAEEQAAADALRDDLLRYLDERAGVPGSPLKVSRRARLEEEIREVVQIPVRTADQFKRSNETVDRVREEIRKRVESSQRSLRSQITRQTEPPVVEIIKEKLRYPGLGSEQAEAWLFRVASAISGEEVTEREQALMVYGFHQEALQRMVSRIERFSRLVELNAPSVIITNDRRLFMQSGATIQTLVLPRRRRHEALKNYEAVLKAFDDLSQIFAADPGPQPGQDPESYEIWKAALANHAREFVELLKAPDNPYLRQTAYRHEFLRDLMKNESNEEALAEMMEAMFEIDEEYAVREFNQMTDGVVDYLRYYRLWYSSGMSLTELRRKLMDVKALLHPKYRKEIDQAREEEKLMEVEYNIPKYLDRLEKLVRLPDINKSADEFFRISDSLEAIDGKLSVPQRERFQAAVKALETRMDESSRKATERVRREAQPVYESASAWLNKARSMDDFESARTAFLEIYAMTPRFAEAMPQEAAEITNSLIEGFFEAARKEHFKAGESAVRDEETVRRLSQYYSGVYEWIGSQEFASIPATAHAIAVMERIESAIQELHTDFRLSRAAGKLVPVPVSAPAPVSYPYSIQFTGRAFRQVLVRWAKDEAFRRKFPKIVDELSTKGLKGDAKVSNWMGLWGDRFDRDAYRIYWRRDGNVITFVGVFHKDETREKGRPAEAYLEQTAALEAGELQLADTLEGQEFLEEVRGRGELRTAQEQGLRSELRASTREILLSHGSRSSRPVPYKLIDDWDSDADDHVRYYFVLEEAGKKNPRRFILKGVPQAQELRLAGKIYGENLVSYETVWDEDGLQRLLSPLVSRSRLSLPPKSKAKKAANLPEDLEDFLRSLEKRLGRSDPRYQEAWIRLFETAMAALRQLADLGYYFDDSLLVNLWVTDDPQGKPQVMLGDFEEVKKLSTLQPVRVSKVDFPYGLHELLDFFYGMAPKDKAYEGLKAILDRMDFENLRGAAFKRRLASYQTQVRDAAARINKMERGELRAVSEGPQPQTELREASLGLIRFYRGMGRLTRDSLKPILETPRAFAEVLEQTAYQIEIAEDAARGLAAWDHFHAILAIDRPLVIDYVITAQDLQRMGNPGPVVRELLKTIRDAVSANANLIVRVQIPDSGLDLDGLFASVGQNRYDRILKLPLAQGHGILLQNVRLSQPSVSAQTAFLTISPGTVQGDSLLLGSDRYEDRTEVAYQGEEGPQVAARFFTAGLVLAAEALSHKSLQELVQYDTGRFRVQSREALDHLGAYVMDLLGEHRAAMLQAAAA